MRLGVKSRLAIVASVMWLVGGSLYFSNLQSDRAADAASASLDICNATNRDEIQAGRPDHQSDCNKEWNDTWAIFTRDLWSHAIELAAIILALFWIAAGILYATVRWILAGRRVQ